LLSETSRLRTRTLIRLSAPVLRLLLRHAGLLLYLRHAHETSLGRHLGQVLGPFLVRSLHDLSGGLLRSAIRSEERDFEADDRLLAAAGE